MEICDEVPIFARIDACSCKCNIRKRILINAFMINVFIIIINYEKFASNAMEFREKDFFVKGSLLLNRNL